MDALRLAVGLLTVVRVRVDRVDRPTARGAMLLAPVVGVGLAAVLVGLGAVARWADLSSLLIASLGAGLLALLTRGLHLDGLADTADGLGVGGPPERALEVMRRSDAGPFGVVTLVLVLLVQVVAAGQLVAADAGVTAALAVVAGRLTLPLAGRAGLPAARADGLGRTVAGAVPVPLALAAAALGTVAVAVIAGLSPGPSAALPAAVATVGGLVAGELLLRRCLRRFGGVTGDVLGAGVEVTTATYLVLAAALLGP